MYELKNSLYFISRHFKQFKVPRVVVVESDLSCSAHYDWNIGEVSEIDGQEIYNETGLIVISSKCTTEYLPTETSILHEYRHHLQFNLHGYWRVPDWSNGESLEDYNNFNVFEKDARLFEVSLGKLDEFTDKFKTVKVSRSTMLNLPTKRFLKSIP